MLQLKRGSNTWVPILHINHEKGICDYMNVYVGTMWYEVERLMKISERNCPVKNVG